MKPPILLAAALLLLIAASGCLTTSSGQPGQQEDPFGTVYLPFPQHSLQELDAALRFLPPAKPGPLLSVEAAQRYTPFPLMLLRCPDLADLLGVRLTKQIYPDGSIGKVFTQVFYKLDEKEITLTELIDPDNKINRPDQAEQVIINGSVGFLVKDWVPDRIEIWWAQNDLDLRLSTDKAVPPDALTSIAQCIR